jgi:hypothetical protein
MFEILYTRRLTGLVHELGEGQKLNDKGRCCNVGVDGVRNILSQCTHAGPKMTSCCVSSQFFGRSQHSVGIVLSGNS